VLFANFVIKPMNDTFFFFGSSIGFIGNLKDDIEPKWNGDEDNEIPYYVGDLEVIED